MCLSSNAEGKPTYQLYGQRSAIPVHPETGRAARANSEGVRESQRSNLGVPGKVETCRPARMATEAVREVAPMQPGLGRALEERPEPGRLMAGRPKPPLG